MIFVAVGTQLPFDRLIRGVDAWAAQHSDIPVTAQTGHLGPDNYHPQHMHHQPTFPPEAFDALCQSAPLMITHAGTGSLMKAHATQTPLLMMPRRAAWGEHRNDHQMATAKSFETKPGVHLVYDEADVPDAINQLINGNTPAPQLSDFADETLITTLREMIFQAR